MCLAYCWALWKRPQKCKVTLRQIVTLESKELGLAFSSDNYWPVTLSCNYQGRITPTLFHRIVTGKEEKFVHESALHVFRALQGWGHRALACMVPRRDSRRAFRIWVETMAPGKCPLHNLLSAEDQEGQKGREKKRDLNLLRLQPSIRHPAASLWATHPPCF